VCLAIPGRVLSVGEGDLRPARVEFGGIVKEVCLAYVPEASVGDYVIVHVGFAISRLDAAEAARVFSYLDEIEQRSELPPEGKR
jgi:hydrogenase expression/formation protein HypC